MESDDLESSIARTDQYADVGGDTSEYNFGSTLIRYANEDGDTVHAATYLGTSKNGTVYTWSKEGNVQPPTIQTTSQSQIKWGGTVQGFGGNKNGGFFNQTLKR